ncbi:hypothetical protein UlMin_008879 [Ulmus minor]
MADTGVVTVYGNSVIYETAKKSPFSVKVGLAQMLHGIVIIDVVNAKQAGAYARPPTHQGKAVTISVMAKARIDHFLKAQILEAIGVDYVNECEVLTIANEDNHINKHNFRIPFICSYRNLYEALREAGTGNIIEAVRHVRSVMGDIRHVRLADMKRMGYGSEKKVSKGRRRKKRKTKKQKYKGNLNFLRVII